MRIATVLDSALSSTGDSASKHSDDAQIFPHAQHKQCARTPKQLCSIWSAALAGSGVHSITSKEGEPMHEHEITTSFAQSSSTDCSIRGGGGAKARTPFGSCPLVIDWFFQSRFRNARIGVVGTSITLQCPTNGMRWSFGSAPFKRQTISSELESGRHRVPISVNNIQNIRKIPGDGWFFFNLLQDKQLKASAWVVNKATLFFHSIIHILSACTG